MKIVSHLWVCPFACNFSFGLYANGFSAETLRKYPPLPNIPRIVRKNYRIPDTDIVLEKGTAVFIPIYAIQRDPDIHPEPEQFKPERFDSEHLEAMHTMAWAPFGEGRRTFTSYVPAAYIYCNYFNTIFYPCTDVNRSTKLCRSSVWHDAVTHWLSHHSEQLRNLSELQDYRASIRANIPFSAERWHVFEIQNS